MRGSSRSTCSDLLDPLDHDGQALGDVDEPEGVDLALRAEPLQGTQHRGARRALLAQKSQQGHVNRLVAVQIAFVDVDANPFRFSREPRGVHHCLRYVRVMGAVDGAAPATYSNPVIPSGR